jgi:hypothetical protein
MKRLDKPKRSEIIKHITVDKYIKAVEKSLVPVGKGWTIFWKGVQVKPEIGNNAFFASEKSAVEAMVRNINSWSIDTTEEVFLGMYGFSQDSPEYDELCGRSLEYKDMSDDQKHNKFEVFDKVESAARNALKTVIIPELISRGILEFREIK